MEESNKRPSEFDENGSSGKKLKTESESGLLDDELNAILSQANGILPANNEPNNDSIDFNNLPDELLDTIDKSISTPDVTPGNSRAATPGLDDKRLPQPGINHTSSNLAQQPVVRANNELYSNDPTKLNDALAAAGVDIHHEEEYLLQQRNIPSRFNQYQSMNFQQPRVPINLLNPYNVSSFMQKVSRENGIVQNFLNDPEILELMSVSCENWLSNIINKTVIMARHRQRGIPNLNKQKPSSIPRSELSKELRNLAHKQKELEEKRVNKRASLGLEKSDESKKGDGKGAEESLHNAANATAAMMSMNPGRKKYSWMTAGAAGNGASSSADKEMKKSHILTARGENGLRYREIRTGQTVTMKDFLTAIEDERIGVNNTLLKGYAKLRD